MDRHAGNMLDTPVLGPSNMISLLNGVISCHNWHFIMEVLWKCCEEHMFILSEMLLAGALYWKFIWILLHFPTYIRRIYIKDQMRLCLHSLFLFHDIELCHILKIHHLFFNPNTLLRRYGVILIPSPISHLKCWSRPCALKMCLLSR